MKLTDFILIRELAGKYRLYDADGADAASLLHAEDLEMAGVSVKGVLLFEQGIRAENGWCYLVREQDEKRALALLKDCSCVILIPMRIQADGSRSMREKAGQPAARVLYADTGGDAVGIFNACSRIFRKYEAFTEDLPLQENSVNILDEILTQAQNVCGNSLVLLRDDLSVCAQADSAEDEPRALQWTIELTNALLQDSSHEANLHRKGVYWGPEDILEYRTMNINLVLPGGRIYILSMEEGRHAMDRADADILGLVAEILHRVLQETESRSGYREGELHRTLISLLQDEAPDFADAARVFSRAGWQRENSYFCLVLESFYADQHGMPARAVCQYLQQMADCCAFPVGDRVVCFFNLSRTGKSADEISAALTQFIRDSLLKAGYSRIRDGYAFLPQLYTQADAALELGSLKHPYTWIHYFDRIGLDYLLEKMGSGMDETMLCHPALLRLLQADREGGTQYMQTLKTYLRNHLNAVHSAKELFIHRSTFLYRMDKIREIIGDILDDPDEVLYLTLSFSLLEKAAGSFDNL